VETKYSAVSTATPRLECIARGRIGLTMQRGASPITLLCSMVLFTSTVVDGAFDDKMIWTDAYLCDLNFFVLLFCIRMQVAKADQDRQDHKSVQESP